MRGVAQITPEAEMVDRQGWDRVRPYRAETLADADVGGTHPRHRGVGEAPAGGTGYAARPPRHLQPDWYPQPHEPPYPDPRWGTRPGSDERAAFRPYDGAIVGEQRRIPPDRPGPPRRAPQRRLDASRWHWLLLLPIVVPLFPPLYNRVEPTLGGVPFFYWGQLSFALLASAVVAIVHLATKPKDR
jgi:hypothetical protein